MAALTKHPKSKMYIWKDEQEKRHNLWYERTLHYVAYVYVFVLIESGCTAINTRAGRKITDAHEITI